MRSDNPAIVQGDLSILLEVDGPRYEPARDVIARFAELEKSPEHVHTYRITPLSLWNAASAGMGAREVLAALDEFARFDVPQNVRANVADLMSRWGSLRLLPAGEPGGPVRLECLDPHLALRLAADKRTAPLFAGRDADERFLVDLARRGVLKQTLLKIGFPVDDRAGFAPGAPLAFALRPVSLGGAPFAPRDYQQEAARIFVEGGAASGGGHGVVVLPCGAGKTVVALAAAAALQTRTLVLTTSRAAVHQWIREALDKTTLTEADVGEYTGTTRKVRPFTVATYHVVAHRAGRRRNSAAPPPEGRAVSGPTPEDLAGLRDYAHFALFDAQDWGLIVYDEVHLLPAPVFRITAHIQARRRLGLTATLVREDRKEGDVFSLIGPKRYDVPWKQMEQQGWIAQASCYEIRLDLPGDRKLAYSTAADGAEAFRIAAENPAKDDVVEELLAGHRGDRILVIGHFIAQLERLARRLGAPLLTGETSTAERERHFDAFRAGDERVLVLSRVGNFSIDLPQANVLVQVSGLFGSRQEEAQRLGRVLRPKECGSTFYTLVSRGTSEQDYALHRQLFLTEQGYRFYVEDWARAEEAKDAEDGGAPAGQGSDEGARILRFNPRRADPA
ncbi:MAG: DEAD/DEAH box helicase [Deltaproteobacteria bacterium]|nr:DEAD/DEAH box helicase [Deltaproteobacteria bacterium]